MIQLILYDYESQYVQKHRQHPEQVAALCVHLQINDNEFVYTRWLFESEYKELIDDEEFHDNLIDAAWKAAGEQLLPLDVTVVKARNPNHPESTG